MTKVNLKDVESRIVKHTPVPYSKSNKVNLNELIKSGRIRKRKKKKVTHTSFPVKCITYDTPEEIEFMKSLLRMRVITNAYKDIVIDLGEEQLFLRLNQIDQLKLIVNLLQCGIDVTIDGCIEESNDENIKQIKVELDKLEKLEIERQAQKTATLEKLMWIRYGNKGNRDPIQKQKELAEFRQQMREIRKAKGLE